MLHGRKMAKLFIIFSLMLVIFTLYFQECKSIPVDDCKNLTDPSGRISYSSKYTSTMMTKCWIKEIPENSVVVFKFETLRFLSPDCKDGSIEVTEWDHDVMTRNRTLLCYNGIPDPYITFRNTTIRVLSWRNIEFEMKFWTESLTCYKKEAFHCEESFCISNEKVCDGIIDCENGVDEANCDNRILSVEGIRESRLAAFNRLEENSNSSAWKNNLHRTIVALYLSGETNFSSRDYLSKNNLLVKQLEFDATVSLFRNSTDLVSSNELSMLVNALLVTCQNPRQFYGFNLVQLLKEQITYSDDTVQPAAYLALCNALEPLPRSSVDRLLQFLNEDSEYLFVPELQAFAIMTISCLLKNGQSFSLNETDIEMYKTSIAKLKRLQQEDGSFGNIHTTALIMQAIMSDKEDYSKHWNMRACVKFLMKQLNSTSDYLSTYYILPILNAKSLADIAQVNCTESGQNTEEKSIYNLKYKSGRKMQVQYSLYLGTNKDVIHTIYLSVPEKTSAYEAMQLASLEDPKYKFQSKSISGKIYVFEIEGYFNDPEAGLFWFKYIESERFNDTLVHCKKSADEIELQENDHLVMWYKRAHF